MPGYVSFPIVNIPRHSVVFFVAWWYHLIRNTLSVHESGISQFENHKTCGCLVWYRLNICSFCCACTSDFSYFVFDNWCRAGIRMYNSKFLTVLWSWGCIDVEFKETEWYMTFVIGDLPRRAFLKLPLPHVRGHGTDCDTSMDYSYLQIYLWYPHWHFSSRA